MAMDMLALWDLPGAKPASGIARLNASGVPSQC